MIRLGLLALGIAVLCLHACDPAGGETGKENGFPYPTPKVEEGGEVVATIGTVVLTTAELEKRIAQQSPFVRAQLKDPEQRKKFVENEVKLELLAQEGWRRDLHNDPRVVAEMRRAIVQRVMRDEMAELTKKVDISEEELRQGYEKRTAEYNKPETIRLAQIVLPKNQKKQAEGLAAKLIAAQKRNDETAFADAARKHSEDAATRNGGGELPFMTREEVEKRVGKEGVARWFDQAEVGTVGIEETQDAVVIFKKTGKRRGIQRTLEMVKPQLRGQLLAEKRSAAFEAYVESLKKKENVVIDEASVRALKVKIDAPTQGTATATTPETKEVEVE
jgi:hypothetical protein